MLELLSLFSCSARTPILILPQLAGHIFLSSFSTQTPILIQLQRSNTFSYSAAWRLDPFPYLAAALGHLFLFSRRPLDTYSYSATAVLEHLSLFRRSAQTPILFSLIVLDIDSYSAIVLDIYSYSAIVLDTYSIATAFEHLFLFTFTVLGPLSLFGRSTRTPILFSLIVLDIYSYSAIVLDTYSYSAASCWTSILIQPHRAGHLFLSSRIVLDIYSYSATERGPSLYLTLVLDTYSCSAAGL